MIKHDEPLTIFLSYAREDKALLEQLKNQLSPLQRQGLVSLWYDRLVEPGIDRAQEIDKQLEQASIILLLISPDFLASDYCYRFEMRRALERHERGEIRVIPIILRPINGWQETPLGSLQALPRDGKPITRWRNRDEAFAQVAEDIRRATRALRPSVFLISTPPDQPFVARLADDLRAGGIASQPTYLEKKEQNPSEASIRAEVQNASVVLLIASPGADGFHSVKEQLDLATMYSQERLVLWIKGDSWEECIPEGWSKDLQILDGRKASYDEVLQKVLTALHPRSMRAFPRVSPPPPSEILVEPRNPYKGLRAFHPEDARDFFGRDGLIDTLVDTVQRSLEREPQGKKGGRLLAVVGASGSGKSSVLQASLLPALQTGNVPGSNTWAYLNPIVPGEHPLDALALALFEQFPEKSFKLFREDLYGDSAHGLHLYASALAKRKGCAHVVLVVDQFEEVFTLTTNAKERQQFLDLLVTACTRQDGPLMVILTLRADFYDRLMQYATLYTLIVNHQIPMLPMTLSDLRAVITHPAMLPDVQLTFEGNLVGDMLFDIQGQIGALPLLQFTLEQLFERREGHLLTEHAYQEIGGIRGALAKYAEETYLALPSQEHRQLTRTLFLRLIDPGMVEQEIIRRRAALTQFIFADPGQTRLMQETRDAFVKARLLTTNANVKTEITTIEVSHEALIREWPRLINWLREARDDIHLQLRISNAAAIWEQYKRPGDRLYQRTELKEAQAWAKRNMVSGQEQAFLKASAARQLRALLTLITVVLLVVTSSGIAGWVMLFQPNPDYVTTTNDDGIGSLRWAINNASSNSTITFASSLRGQTILLKTADLHVTQHNLTIQGPATGRITVRESGVSFVVDKPSTVTIADIAFQGSHTNPASVIVNEGKLALKTCSVSGNTAGRPDSTGGGIENNGTLTLTNSTVSDNTAPEGGGIWNGGTLTITSSTLSGNTAGGGIWNDGTLTLTSSTLSHNTAATAGGGISNYGTLTITSSTLSHNAAYGYKSKGGGIWNCTTITITNSTLSDNTASGPYSHGGGIDNDGFFNSGSTITITNSTLSDNTASGPYSYGGGIANMSIPNTATLTITSSTLSGNTASGPYSYGGGGILNDGILTLTNSTLSDNTASSSRSAGGGIENEGTLTLTNSTLSDNTAIYGGNILTFTTRSGATKDKTASVALVFCTIVNAKEANRDGFDITIEGSAPGDNFHLVMKSDIVGGNDTQANPIVGAITSYGYNVIQQMSSVQFVPGSAHIPDHSIDTLTNVFGSAPTLQTNGGPTKTYQLIPDTSDPAWNMVPLAACTDVQGQPIRTDQRDMPRPGKNKQSCDSGAYEYQASS